VINTNSKRVEEVLTRGVAEVISKDHLKKRMLAGEKLRVKLGIDPTSPDIHLGRSIPLLKLRDFQELGHKIFLIIGDFTGLVGDTSDKSSERPMLDRKTIERNKKTYLEQAKKILETENKEGFELCHNSKWLAKLNYQEIGEQANIFSLAEFIARENIKKRLEGSKRVSLRELLYPLMQGYDSVAIKADLELGGTDQRFNLLAGRRLQEHFDQKAQDILMNNLIEGLDGRKMSSTWGNTINITDDPNDMFGKVMSMSDDLIIKYFIHCTRLPMAKVLELEKGMKEGENPKKAKEELALEITKMYHDPKEDKESTEMDYSPSPSRAAQEDFKRVFNEKGLPKNIPTAKVEAKELNILDLLVETALCKSKSEARQMVEQGAVKIDQKPVSDWQAKIKNLNNKVVQVGKRKYCKIKN